MTGSNLMQAAKLWSDCTLCSLIRALLLARGIVRFAGNVAHQTICLLQLYNSNKRERQFGRVFNEFFINKYLSSLHQEKLLKRINDSSGGPVAGMWKEGEIRWGLGLKSTILLWIWTMPRELWEFYASYLNESMTNRRLQ